MVIIRKKKVSEQIHYHKDSVEVQTSPLLRGFFFFFTLTFRLLRKKITSITLRSMCKKQRSWSTGCAQLQSSKKHLPFLEHVCRGDLDSYAFLLKRIWVHLHSGNEVVEPLNYSLYLNSGIPFSPIAGAVD